MANIRKSKEEARELGANLRGRRKELGYTLMDLRDAIGIDVGQLSRFEQGEFKIISKNLQKNIDYLHNSQEDNSQPELVQQFVKLIKRSERHEAAARALVQVLDALK